MPALSGAHSQSWTLPTIHNRAGMHRRMQGVRRPCVHRTSLREGKQEVASALRGAASDTASQHAVVATRPLRRKTCAMRGAALADVEGERLGGSTHIAQSAPPRSLRSCWIADATSGRRKSRRPL
eukprot:2389899-Prymnesium_polylepis.1